MRQFLKSGSARGVRSNPHPYRDRVFRDFQVQWESPLFGLFHGASFPQPFARAFRFSYCAPPIIRIYDLVAFAVLSQCSGSAPNIVLSRMES